MFASKPQWLLALALATMCGVVRAEVTNPFRTRAAAEETSQTAEEIDAPAAGDPDCQPMNQLGVDIGLPAGKLPTAAGPPRCHFRAFAGNLPRPWPTQIYHWEAAATRHQPLYFEEINAERYGYSCNWVAQPFVSAAHFFGTIPALPYLKATNCPSECQYTLGHYRPGSCPPYRFHCWPVDCLGAAAEVGTFAWLVLVLP